MINALAIKKLTREIESEFKVPGSKALFKERRWLNARDGCFGALGDKKSRFYGHFYFCNEHYPDSDKQNPCDFRRVIQAFNNMEAGTGKENPARIMVACLTGESCLLSAAPEIARSPCSAVFMVDIDYSLLKVQLKRLELIRKYKSIKDEAWFKKEIYQYIRLNFDADWKYEDYERRYKIHKGFLSNYHPFSSDQRLLEVVNAINNLTITPVPCDYFNGDDVRVFSEILKGNDAEIALINISNIMDYYEDFYKINKFSFSGGKPVPFKHLRNYLPLNEQTLCVYSKMSPFILRTKQGKLYICDQKSFWEGLYKLHSLAKRSDHARGYVYSLENNIIRACPDYLDSLLLILRYLVDADEQEIEEMKQERDHLEQEIRSQAEDFAPDQLSHILNWIDETIGS